MQCNPTDILIFAENKVPAESLCSRDFDALLNCYWADFFFVVVIDSDVTIVVAGQ